MTASIRFRTLSLVTRGIFSLSVVMVTAVAIRAERLPIHVYTTADGLSSSAINWVMRDSRGFLWFGTRDGLSRFDGQKFTTYRLESGQPPSIGQIIQRRRGDYLIALQSGGIYRFDAQTVVSADATATSDEPLTLHAEQIADHFIGYLFEDREQRLWASGNGLLAVTESGGHLQTQPVDLRLPGQPAPTNIRHMIEARDGSLWMSTSIGLLRRAPDGKLMCYGLPSSSPIANFLTDVLEDSQGLIWCGTRRGVFVLRPMPLSDERAFISRPLKAVIQNPQPAVLPGNQGDLIEYISSEGNLTFGLYQTKDQRVWLTSKNGLSVFDGHEFKSYDTRNGVSPKLGMMVEDLDGNLWLGTFTGAFKLVTYGLTTFGKEDGLGDQTIRSIYQNSAGELYVVNGDWNVSQLQGRTFNTVRPRLGDIGELLWMSNVALLDENNAWWFLSERKLIRYDTVPSLRALLNRKPTATFDSGINLPAGGFYRLFDDSHGRVWISSRSNKREEIGLTVWDRASNSLHTFGTAENYPAGRPASAFCEDHGGNLWVGFYHGGVARFRDDKFTLVTGAPAGFVTAIYLDSRSRLWVATGDGGLGRIDDPNAEHPVFVNYTTANGLASNNVRAITEDNVGRIYLGTVRGIDRLSPETGRVKHYTMADGLTNEFITVAFRDRDGGLWFGTQDGLSRLTPEPDSPAPAPPIMIGGLRVAGVKQPLSELGQTEVGRLQLNYTQANLQIDFFSLSFASAERIRYQHMLEGADRDWSAPASERTVSYANLAPGTYRFLVRAVNADGVASRAPAVFSFRIAPPFWLRWWFMLASIVLFGAIVYWVARVSLLRKLELERVRTRIASDLHDDIGASLTRIAMLSEVTRRHEGGVPVASAQRLTQIADNARSLVDSMSDIVWAIDPRRDDFGSVIDRVRSFAADTLGTAGVRWQLTVAPRLEERPLTPEQRRALYLIFKEAISNIARHADCRQASLRIDLDHSTLSAVIEDDGRGFGTEPSGNGRGGHGLSNMKARAAELGGRLEIGPRADGGTRLCLTLPLPTDGMNMFLRARAR